MINGALRELFEVEKDAAELAAAAAAAAPTAIAEKSEK